MLRLRGNIILMNNAFHWLFISNSVLSENWVLFCRPSKIEFFFFCRCLLSVCMYVQILVIIEWIQIMNCNVIMKKISKLKCFPVTNTEEFSVIVIFFLYILHEMVQKQCHFEACKLPMVQIHARNWIPRVVKSFTTRPHVLIILYFVSGITEAFWQANCKPVPFSILKVTCKSSAKMSLFYTQFDSLRSTVML